MPRNTVQFRKGLSEPEFERLYGSEDKCRAQLLAWRWPKGFECPACAGTAQCIVKQEGRELYQCNACRTQTSLISGTIFASTKLELKVWFRAMYLMTQTKQGISRLELSRRLGVAYGTAWMIHHKLAQVMLERDRSKPLDGRVEMDDAYLGGEHNGGKRGRGSPGKMPIVAAVETTKEGRPVRLKIRHVKRFSKKHIEGLVAQIVKRGATVVTDGLGCFRGAAAAAALTRPSSPARDARLPAIRPSSGSTPRSATSSARSSAPSARSARNMRRARSPRSSTASTAATI